MAPQKPQLQAAITQFASQQGITPDQVAQLEAAIAADADLAHSLNQQAASGHLAGFALEQPAGTPSLIGTYDPASHLVTLPASTFQPSGHAPSHELSASLRLQDMSIRFSQASTTDANNVTHTVTPDMVTNLQAAAPCTPVVAQPPGW